MLEFHNSPCVTISVDNNNKYFYTGGSDSLIGVWDMEELMVVKTISKNDHKIITLGTSHDSQFVAGIFEDDINKQFHVEIYETATGQTMYKNDKPIPEHKNALAWHPKRHLLACAGEGQ